MNENETFSLLSPCPPETVARHLPAQARIIDIGCGEGELLRYLSDKGMTPVGVEPDAERRAKAAQCCPELQVVNASAEKLPFSSASFDAAVMQCVFSLCKPLETVKELARILVPGGLAVVSDMYLEAETLTFTESPVARRGYSKTELEGFFSRDFLPVSFEEHTHELREMFVQMIMDEKINDCFAPGEIAQLRSARPGYGLWLWKKH